MSGKKVRNPFRVREHRSHTIDNWGETEKQEVVKDNSEYKYHLQLVEGYNGQWERGLRQGTGVQAFPTGERYEGEWKEDKMHGHGCITYPSGETFEGSWADGKRLYGTLTILFGSGSGGSGVCGHVDIPVTCKKMEYRGSFTDGVPGSVGEICWDQYGRYYGSVSSISSSSRTLVPTYRVFRQGYGEMIWQQTGERYIGDWKNDLRHGYGISVLKSGERHHGTWKKGKKSGHGVTLLCDGTWYDGIHSGDERKGKGRMWLPNGDCLGGEWAGDKVTNATFHKGSFEDVPRPIKGIAVANVTKTLKSEDKNLFMTAEKWQPLVYEILQNLNSFPTVDVVANALVDRHDPSQALRDIGLGEVAEVLEKFIYIFHWEFGDFRKTPSSSKFSIFHFQLAVDDINFFFCFFFFPLFGICENKKKKKKKKKSTLR
eukprot:TRINITY_DN11930_c0_g2_i2.p1 TRINITY_DN11930_c0_g2~~TRINITY_DN11930_c0_g2_i2.p1  ORF type:complete len:429 (+),score=88.35 TRINITY_DN11930_c0_g2_i2:80-1366(+)